MSRRAPLRLRLYVAGHTRNSAQAIANLDALRASHLAAKCEVEVIDVTRHPRRALDDGVLMTPMLVKLSPAPVCRIVGTLSDATTVLEALGVGPG
jgi:circadian clock protein KaiB